jgi:hypothetical protein
MAISPKTVVGIEGPSMEGHRFVVPLRLTAREYDTGAMPMRNCTVEEGLGVDASTTQALNDPSIEKARRPKRAFIAAKTVESQGGYLLRRTKGHLDSKIVPQSSFTPHGARVVGRRETKCSRLDVHSQKSRRGPKL